MIINFQEIAEKYSISIEIVRNFFDELIEVSWLFETAEINENIFEFQANDNKSYAEILTSGHYVLTAIEASLLPYLLANGVNVNLFLGKALKELDIQIIEAAIDFSKNDIYYHYIETISIIGRDINNQKMIDFANANNIEPVKFKNEARSTIEKVEIFSQVNSLLYGIDSDINILKDILKNEYILSRIQINRIITSSNSSSVNYQLYKELISIHLKDTNFLDNNNASLLLSLCIKNNDALFLEEALKYIKDFNYLEKIPFNTLPSTLEKILDKGLKPSVALGALYRNTANEEEQSSSKIQLLEIILKRMPSLEVHEWYYTSLDELNSLKKYYPVDEIIEKVIELTSKNVNDDTAGYISNRLGITRAELTEIQEKFIKELFDTNDGSINKFVCLNEALGDLSINIFNYILEQLTPAEKASYTPDPAHYLQCIMGNSFRESSAQLEATMICPENLLIEYIRANGANLSSVEIVINFSKLLKNYIDTVKGGKNLLNQKIINILDNNIQLSDLDQISKDENNTNFTINELVLISGRFDLIEQMSINDILKSRIINILLIFYKLNENSVEKTKLLKKIINASENVDLDLGNGERLTDALIQNNSLAKKVLGKTKDPLFELMKKDASLISLDQKFIHIAISNSEGFWSTGVWSLARLIREKYPEVKFYLVNEEMIENGGDNFIKQFDGWINPGGSDTYPEHLPEFKKEDCEFALPIEKLYQKVLKVTEKFSIPLLSMCAGAQHLTMFKGGSVSPVGKKYHSGENLINIIQGTLTHFFHLNKNQQENFLKTLELPEISFKADTAHRYAAKNLQNLELGAKSEDGVPMAYVTEDGLARATQFHPEHYYKSSKDNAIHQRAWIDSFVKLTEMFHQDKQDNNHRVQEHMEVVKDCLQIWNFVEHLFDQVGVDGVSVIG